VARSDALEEAMLITYPGYHLVSKQLLEFVISALSVVLRQFMQNFVFLGVLHTLAGF
jgi:hypothetical protein